MAFDLASLKNTAFSEEDEVRLIHLVNFQPSNGSLRIVDPGGTSFGKPAVPQAVGFHLSKGIPVAHLDLDFTNSGTISPVGEVVLGPKNDSRWRTSRALAYAWAAPATLVGLVVASLALALGATARLHDSVIEVGGGSLGVFPVCLRLPVPFVAITLGHVVIGQSHAVLAGLRVHEHAHVRQYERWGVPFFAAYLGSSAVQWLCGRDPYRDNRFEREARAAEQAAARRGPGHGV